MNEIKSLVIVLTEFPFVFSGLIASLKLHEVVTWVSSPRSVPSAMPDANVASRAVGREANALTCPHNFSSGRTEHDSVDTPSAPALARALLHYFGVDDLKKALPPAMPNNSRVSKLVQAGWVDAAFVAPWWEDAKALARWAQTGTPRPSPRALPDLVQYGTKKPPALS